MFYIQRYLIKYKEIKTKFKSIFHQNIWYFIVFKITEISITDTTLSPYFYLRDSEGETKNKFQFSPNLDLSIIYSIITLDKYIGAWHFDPQQTHKFYTSILSRSPYVNYPVIFYGNYASSNNTSQFEILILTLITVILFFYFYYFLLYLSDLYSVTIKLATWTENKE